MKSLFKGSLFHTPSYGKMEFIEDALIEVNPNGIIEKLVRKEDSNYNQLLKEARQDGLVEELKAGQYFLPGFIDLHVHAPQWPQVGVSLDDPLNIWLDECTFPLEASYKDIEFAKTVYQDLVKTLLARGTTTVLYFATIHNEASLELAKICAHKGQRAFVGKVVMDDKNTCPDFYRDESTEIALANTEKFIKDVRQLAKNVKQGVYPVVTPRFVPSCTDEALRGLGQIAQKYDVHVQSHCSEGDWQDNFVKERFGKRDAEVLESFGLLRKKSVMAHCNFLDEVGADIFIKNHTAIGHCPLSNSYFANAVLPVKRLKERGVTIGLGTDISAGFTPSLYDNLRHAVVSSRMLEDGVDPAKSPQERGLASSRISALEAFYLATRGGGEALDIPVGTFEVGQICDLQVIDMSIDHNKLDQFNIFIKPQQILEKILYLTTPENIRKVYVQGQLVHSRD
ncbi:guanine deaminase [Streptococcus didelphis]|uniref:Guanine deaminase n=1 Tax=Streptococcus didelphis TaxID=102886 RepID=A0ABY9LHZ2_9STRE|nr:guanine deaminase [Streptococcus didelphis]WMB28405.1 guanine deaminase [Streptococcus didelphis]